MFNCINSTQKNAQSISRNQGTRAKSHLQQLASISTHIYLPRENRYLTLKVIRLPAIRNNRIYLHVSKNYLSCKCIQLTEMKQLLLFFF